MRPSPLVNFHCHSIFSDGEQSPEALVASLADAGVRCAALTDHDTVEGFPRFREAMNKRSIACLPGIEITTLYNGREAHLLGYGFDPDHPDLLATLISLRQSRALQVHSISDSLRKMGANRQETIEKNRAVSSAPDGWLEIGAAIELLHRAGGRVFWAHPLSFEADPDRLDVLVAELKEMGLDGLEAIYSPYSSAQQALIRRLARKHGMLISAGTDAHGSPGNGSQIIGVAMPGEDWESFRDAFFTSASFKEDRNSFHARKGLVSAGSEDTSTKPHQLQLRSFVLRIFLPTFSAIALFLAAFWGLILPSFENTLLARKWELIRELTNSAYSILASYELDERNGLLTREEAQQAAIERIQSLRYGPEGKDYFWIQDMHPRMIMHPYRSDLNGKDLEDFRDPRGVAIFVEFADLVRREGEGYIDYVWQWKDDPQRLEPKESFVKGFEPWDWIIGTGIYIDDVESEIARIETNLINTALVISGAVVLLLIFVLQQSLRIERERQEVLENFRDSTLRYQTLVEATTEGTLLIMDGRCRYANSTFLVMVGYTSSQLQFLDMVDLLPRDETNSKIWQKMERMDSPEGDEGEKDDVFEAVIKRRDGGGLECIISLTRILISGQQGLILLARDLARRSNVMSRETIPHAALSIPVGVFRARAVRKGVLVEYNPTTHLIFNAEDNEQLNLADLFSDPEEFDAFLEKILTQGAVDRYIVYLANRFAPARILSISGRLVHNDHDGFSYIDGVIQDVTLEMKHENEREALIEKMQTSLLFFHEPISSLGRDALICDLDTTVRQVTRLMTARGVTAALISSGTTGVIGIVTDHDLRARVLAEAVSIDTTIHSIMSAPLTRISEHAMIYEALILMEERGVRHLAVEDDGGQIVSVIDSKTLIHFPRYGPIVVTREISRAQTPDDVSRNVSRTPALAKALLDSSARPQYVTNMLSSICDVSTIRLVELAIQELGPPPAEFAFIAMGSQGRQEQTLLTDQDNGIIYSLPEGVDPLILKQYFLQLGGFVCAGLDHAGYSLCRGSVMANNPRWCRSISEWIEGFSGWVQNPEAQEIINLSIFFDFRTVFGQAALTHELRRFIHSTLVEDTAFFHHFARNALLFKPPIRLPGNIYLGGGASDHSGEINLKDATMPIVSFARLYALRNQVNQTHTIERIEELADRKIILPSSRDEIIAAYDFLMQLRFQTQIQAVQLGQPPQNILHPAKLGYIQRELLKQAFSQISAVQKKVGYDFLGGV
jgi:PAS domain S-box-containing protein